MARKYNTFRKEERQVMVEPQEVQLESRRGQLVKTRLKTGRNTFIWTFFDFETPGNANKFVKRVRRGIRLDGEQLGKHV